jgi:hypothetical protein
VRNCLGPDRELECKGDIRRMLGFPSTGKSFAERAERCARIEAQQKWGRPVAGMFGGRENRKGHDTSKPSNEDYLTKPLDAGARYAERRCVPRYPYNAITDVLDPVARTSFKGRTTEISTRGCYVELANPFPKNTVFQLRIQRDAETFETWGRVAYAQEGQGMGVAFLQTAPEHEKIIAAWIAEISVA